MVDTGNNRLCPKCTLTSISSGQLCAGCNTLKSKIHRIIHGKDEELVDDWDLVDAEKKKALFVRSQEEHGFDLAVEIKLLTNEARTERTQARFVASGALTDKEDLEEKYKKKPEQLANIFANAYNFMCPIRKCQLWADPAYVKTNAWESEKETKRTMETESTRRLKKSKTTQKKPKVKKENGDDKDDAEDAEEQKEWELGEADCTTITAATNKLDPEMEAFQKAYAEVTVPVKKEISAAFVKKLDLLQCELAGSIASAKLAVATKTATSDPKALAKKLISNVKVAKALLNDLKKRVKTAEKDIAA